MLLLIAIFNTLVWTVAPICLVRWCSWFSMDLYPDLLHFYLEVISIDFSGAYFQANVHRIVARLVLVE